MNTVEKILLKEKQNEFVELFNVLSSWQERFQYLIEIGEQLPEMPEHLKIHSTLIKPCGSVTYFYATAAQGCVHIEGWSNAAVSSGLIMMLKNIFEGVSVEQLKETEIDFHIRTELKYNLTALRKEALEEMINRICRV